MAKENWQKTLLIKLSTIEQNFVAKCKYIQAQIFGVKGAFTFNISLNFTSPVEVLNQCFAPKKSNIFKYESTGAKVAFIRVKLKPVWFAFTGWPRIQWCWLSKVLIICRPRKNVTPLNEENRKKHQMISEIWNTQKQNPLMTMTDMTTVQQIQIRFNLICE